jgi:hypothetical protein
MRVDELKDLADELGRETTSVAITLTLPIVTTALGDEQGPTRVRNAARAATAALPRIEVSADERRALEARLADLEGEVSRQNGFGRVHRGLACYITPTITRVVRLAHTPPERVIVADAFSLAAPIRDLATDDSVDVIVLSTGGGSTPGARLYRFADGVLAEVSDDDLPMAHDIRDDYPRDASEGTPDAKARDIHLEAFLRDVDTHLVKLLGRDHHRRIVIVGIERMRTHFAAVRSETIARAVVAEIDGNVDRVPTPTLADEVRRAVADADERAALAAIAAFNELAPARTAAGAEDVHAMAAEGRVHRLFVEDGATDVVAVDGVIVGDRISGTIRAAYDAGAEITIVPRGALGERGPVAAIARW